MPALKSVKSREKSASWGLVFRLYITGGGKMQWTQPAFKSVSVESLVRCST